MSRATLWISMGMSARRQRITIGSSDRGSTIFVEPGRGSMIGIKRLRFALAQPRVAQLHR